MLLRTPFKDEGFRSTFRNLVGMTPLQWSNLKPDDAKNQF